jgi:hypothetical protein
VLTPGTYIETKPNVIFFSTKELRLYPDGRLAFFQWSDAINSSQQAAGTYRLRGKHLELTFDGSAPMPPSQAAHPLPAATNGKGVLFTVRCSDGEGKAEPLPGANVVLRDSASRTIEVYACDQAGQTVLLPLKQTSKPHSVEVYSIGFQSWKQT